jgi:PAS domain S-box-containing protein
MLSQHDFPHMLTQAVQAGASAYVVKSAISTDLLPALQIAVHSKRSAWHVFGSAQVNLPVQEILKRGAALELALRDSEELYRLTFEQAAVGIAHIALNGRWLRVNRILCEVLGYAEDELLQQRVGDVTHPADLNEEREQMARLVSGAISQYVMEKRYVRENGVVVWAKVSVLPVYDASMKSRYFVQVTEDISGRKEAEAACGVASRNLREKTPT